MSNGLSKDVTVVTDGFHQYRAQFYARKMGLEPLELGRPLADMVLGFIFIFFYEQPVIIANSIM